MSSTRSRRTSVVGRDFANASLALSVKPGLSLSLMSVHGVMDVMEVCSDAAWSICCTDLLPSSGAARSTVPQPDKLNATAKVMLTGLFIAPPLQSDDVTASAGQ